MLFLVATPIGNLEDISFRAINTLKNCDYILCEDTRHSKPLLKHFEIQTPVKSYHKFNEAQQEISILRDLNAGKNIAILSDAGTPGIADPGERLVQKCISEKIPLTAIPGPCSVIQALVCSGFNTQPFQFLGFAPKKEKERKQFLQKLLEYEGSSICFETPQRIKKTLTILEELDAQAEVSLAREMTKKFEEFLRGTPTEVKDLLKILKGEIVLVIRGKGLKPAPHWNTLSILEHVKLVQKQQNISQKEAIKLIALERGIPKKEVYRATLHF